MNPTAPTQLLPPRAVVVPPQVAVAFGEIGVVEDTRPGKSNPRVEQYHGITNGGPASDDVSWCASFLGWCLEMAGIRSTRSKTASSYETYGEAGDWSYGDIVFLPHTDPDAGGTGHVGFNLGIVGDHFYMLAGNQNNRVGVDLKPREGAIVRRPPRLKAA